MNSAYDVEVLDGVAYVADWFDGLLMVEVSDPSNLELRGRADTLVSAYRVAIVEDLVLVADLQGGLVLFRIGEAPPRLTTDPRRPVPPRGNGRAPPPRHEADRGPRGEATRTARGGPAAPFRRAGGTRSRSRARPGGSRG
ncbi:MAG: hypothetical protein GF346_09515 [Candidatus Eisenbacteria bacterium]|nr:hypothetical protein [Candidatus Latescibacterota bacterium]MBD3302670.1 hypothetical protein [Candidatus Eisenbacteria bacterium]